MDLNLAVVREVGGQAVIENEPSVVKTWRIDEVVTSALYEVDSVFSPDISRDLQERTKLRQKSKLTKAEKAKLKKLDDLANKLVPAFDKDDERALNVIQRAAKLLDVTKK